MFIKVPYYCSRLTITSPLISNMLTIFSKLKNLKPTEMIIPFSFDSGLVKDGVTGLESKLERVTIVLLQESASAPEYNIFRRPLFSQNFFQNLARRFKVYTVTLWTKHQSYNFS